MPCSSQIVSEMLPEIHTVEKSDFIKFKIHSQIIKFSVFHEVTALGTTMKILNIVQVDLSKQL